MNNITETTCNSPIIYHCWDCKENCLVKQIISSPEPFFWRALHDSYSSNVGYLMARGMSVKDAEYAQNLRVMSLVAARAKMGCELTLLK